MSLIISLLIIWALLCLMGLPSFKNWYSIKYYDKIIHLLAGIIITIYLINIHWSIYNIILINLILAYLWEWGQIWTKDIFKLKVIGFPDGYYDIIFHMMGTLGYLYFIGLL